MRMEKRNRLDKAMLICLKAFCVVLILTVALLLLGENNSLFSEMLVGCVFSALTALAVIVLCLICRFADRVSESRASNPSGVTVSEKKLSALLQLFGNDKLNISDKHMITYIAMDGECQPAVVMRTDPLLIATYSEDMDCVAMLRFPNALCEICGLVKGSRLVTANTYQMGRTYASDLIKPEGRNRFSNMQPIVLDFISDSPKALSARKRAIPEQVWSRAEKLGREYLLNKPGIARSGDPRRTYEPGEAQFPTRGTLSTAIAV